MDEKPTEAVNTGPSDQFAGGSTAHARKGFKIETCSAEVLAGEPHRAPKGRTSLGGADGSAAPYAGPAAASCREEPEAPPKAAFRCDDMHRPAFKGSAQLRSCKLGRREGRGVPPLARVLPPGIWSARIRRAPQQGKTRHRFLQHGNVRGPTNLEEGHCLRGESWAQHRQPGYRCKRTQAFNRVWCLHAGSCLCTMVHVVATSGSFRWAQGAGGHADVPWQLHSPTEQSKGTPSCVSPIAAALAATTCQSPGMEGAKLTLKPPRRCRETRQKESIPWLPACEEMLKRFQENLLLPDCGSHRIIVRPGWASSGLWRKLWMKARPDGAQCVPEILGCLLRSRCEQETNLAGAHRHVTAGPKPRPFRFHSLGRNVWDLLNA